MCNAYAVHSRVLDTVCGNFECTCVYVIVVSYVCTCSLRPRGQTASFFSFYDWQFDLCSDLSKFTGKQYPQRSLGRIPPTKKGGLALRDYQSLQTSHPESRPGCEKASHTESHPLPRSSNVYRLAQHRFVLTKKKINAVWVQRCCLLDLV